MKKALLFILPVITVMTIVSCQKALTDPTVTGGIGGTGGTGGADITGNWKFISVSAITQSSVQFTLAGSTYKTVTNTNYTSINNGGTAIITSNTMTSTGITYDVNSRAYALSYLDNVLIDTTSLPFIFHLPPYGTTSPYKRVNQDSIYYTSQGLDPSVSGGSGAHIALSGNTLTVTSSIVKDTTINAGGIPASQHSTAIATTTLQRQ